MKGLTATRRIAAIGVEGAFEEIPLGRLRAFADRAAVREVARYHLRRGWISGPVYAALTMAPPPPRVVGIDDRRHYEANVSALLETRRDAGRLGRRARALLDRLERDAVRHAQPSLRSLLRSRAALEGRRIGLGDHAARLAAAGPVSEPAVDAFLATLALERAIDYDAAERERLAALAGGPNAEANHFPHLSAYRHYAARASRIDAVALLDALERMEMALETHLAATPGERRLCEAMRYLRLLARLSEFSLTSGEWRLYRQARERVEETGPRALRNLSRSPAVRAFEAFYAHAEARNAILAENALALTEGGGDAIVVAGGFHADDLERRLAARGTRVVRLTPRLSTTGGRDASYLSEFMREKSPLERLLQRERVFLALDPGAGVRRAPVDVAATHVRRHPRASLTGSFLDAGGDPLVRIAGGPTDRGMSVRSRSSHGESRTDYEFNGAKLHGIHDRPPSAWRVFAASLWSWSEDLLRLTRRLRGRGQSGFRAFARAAALTLTIPASFFMVGRETLFLGASAPVHEATGRLARAWLARLIPDGATVELAAGMGFHEQRTWWGEHSPRPAPLHFHSGLDFARMRDPNGRALPIPESAPVTSMTDGVVLDVVRDEMQWTVFVKTNVFDARGRALVMNYTHIALPPGRTFAPGQQVRAGELLGTIEKSLNPRSAVARHLHLSAAWMTPRAVQTVESTIAAYNARGEKTAKDSIWNIIDPLVAQEKVFEYFDPMELFRPGERARFARMPERHVLNVALVHLTTTPPMYRVKQELAYNDPGGIIVNEIRKEDVDAAGDGVTDGVATLLEQISMSSNLHAIVTFQPEVESAATLYGGPLSGVITLPYPGDERTLYRRLESLRQTLAILREPVESIPGSPARWSGLGAKNVGQLLNLLIEAGAEADTDRLRGFIRGRLDVPPREEAEIRWTERLATRLADAIEFRRWEPPPTRYRDDEIPSPSISMIPGVVYRLTGRIHGGLGLALALAIGALAAPLLETWAVAWLWNAGVSAPLIGLIFAASHLFFFKGASTRWRFVTPTAFLGFWIEGTFYALLFAFVAPHSGFAAFLAALAFHAPKNAAIIIAGRAGRRADESGRLGPIGVEDVAGPGSASAWTENRPGGMLPAASTVRPPLRAVATAARQS